MQAYPAIYSWATFPLTALIETNWELYQRIERKYPDDIKGTRTLVGITEVTSCAERALNFMHTGNPAVIKTTVMNPLWIGRAIINDGLPCFNPNLVKPKPIKVTYGHWVYDEVRNLPKSSSESALRYRYNELTVAVSILKLYLPKKKFFITFFLTLTRPNNFQTRGLADLHLILYNPNRV